MNSFPIGKLPSLLRLHFRNGYFASSCPVFHFPNSSKSRKPLEKETNNSPEGLRDVIELSFRILDFLLFVCRFLRVPSRSTS